MKKLEFHPSSDVFRLLEGEEYNRIRASIKKHGQQVSIKCLDGMVLDGRNRYRACIDEKVDPWLEHLSKSDLDGMSPTDYVVCMNDDRRHDDIGQRALAAARIKERYTEEAKERQKGGVPVRVPEGGDARDKAGEAMGVSGKTVDLAEKVLNNATPEVIAAVEKGTVAVSDAAKIVDLSPAKQNAAVEKVESGKAPTLAAATKPKQSPGVPFQQLEKILGKAIRFADNLNKSKPCARQHKVIHDALDTASKAIHVWRKSVT